MSFGFYNVNQFEMFKYSDISYLTSISGSQFLVDSAETGICGSETDIGPNS